MLTRARLITCALTVTAVAGVRGEERSIHIRVVDPKLRAYLDDAALRSQTMRERVTRIEAASVVVFIDCEPFLPGPVSGRVGFVTRVQELRYVRIDVRCALRPVRLMPVLAHELQHVLEIGEDLSIVDVDSMESYYESVGYEIGRKGSHRSFETRAAREIERRVEQELTRSRK